MTKDSPVSSPSPSLRVAAADFGKAVCYGGDCSAVYYSCSSTGVAGTPSLTPTGVLCVGGQLSLQQVGQGRAGGQPHPPASHPVARCCCRAAATAPSTRAPAVASRTLWARGAAASARQPLCQPSESSRCPPSLRAASTTVPRLMPPRTPARRARSTASPTPARPTPSLTRALPSSSTAPAPRARNTRRSQSRPARPATTVPRSSRLTRAAAPPPPCPPRLPAGTSRTASSAALRTTAPARPPTRRALPAPRRPSPTLPPARSAATARSCLRLPASTRRRRRPPTPAAPPTTSSTARPSAARSTTAARAASRRLPRRRRQAWSALTMRS